MCKRPLREQGDTFQSCPAVAVAGEAVEEEELPQDMTATQDKRYELRLLQRTTAPARLGKK